MSDRIAVDTNVKVTGMDFTLTDVHTTVLDTSSKLTELLQRSKAVPTANYADFEKMLEDESLHAKVIQSMETIKRRKLDHSKSID